MDGRPPADSLLASLDTALVLDAVPEFLSWLERSAPARLVDAVTGLRILGSSQWRALLDRCLRGRSTELEPGDAASAFVVEALVQPLAEQLAHRRSHAETPAEAALAAPKSGAECPFCDSLPVVGALREAGHGAKRSLLCGLCLSEWDYLRLVCPACGERKFDALPVYTAEQISGARVEGCDTCRAYLKTIDATKDGLAVPLVDDLATVALDLWARDQGYIRLRPNLLRT